MKVKDLQFAKYFLLNEINLPDELSRKILDTEVELQHLGEPDSVTVRDGHITIRQPSSIVRFLYNVLYHVLKPYSSTAFGQDNLSLGLLHACMEYVYNDEPSQSVNALKPPVVMSFDKMSVASVIIEDFIEPLTGHVSLLPVFFLECNFVDACSVIKSSSELCKKHVFSYSSVSCIDKYPILVVNRAIQNKASWQADLVYTILVYNFGSDKTSRILKNIILNKDENIGKNLISAIKILEGDPIFLIDFLNLLESNVILSNDEIRVAASIREQLITSDSFLKNKIKIAQQGKYTPQVFKQWHQWSMIQGLIEKQLAPMRGSMWPASETVKPFEDKHRQMAAERAKKKGKIQLNYEEMLEVAREIYDHKAVQPGELHETLLKDNRVWKT